MLFSSEQQQQEEWWSLHECLPTLFCPIAVHVLKENGVARLVAVVLGALVAVVVVALLSRCSGLVVDECFEAMRLCSCNCSYDSYTRGSFCCVLVLTLRVLRSLSLLLLFERFVRLMALLLISYAGSTSLVNARSS